MEVFLRLVPDVPTHAESTAATPAGHRCISDPRSGVHCSDHPYGTACVHGVVLPMAVAHILRRLYRCPFGLAFGRSHRSHMASARHQARRRRVGDERMNRAVHEIPQVTPLAQAGFVTAEAERQELVAAQRACGPGDFSLEHNAAQRLLGGIVGRCQARIRCERPQRGPQLEDVGAGVGRAAALLLLRTTLQHRSHSTLQPIEHVADQLRRVNTN